MRILVDIGHPAHVHYFRNAIFNLKVKGHEVLITTRDKEVTLALLDNYKLPYICTGKNKAGVIKKLLTMVRNDMVIYREARRFKPDIFLSFFSPFAAQVGRFMKKPVIGFTDTELAKLSIKLTKPFTDYIFTPHCFWDDFGANHFRFNGYMETFYLHPKYFTPNENVLKELGVAKGEKYFVMRFVSFNASHDIGESGMDNNTKIELAAYLASKGKLFISSESPLPPQLELYRLKTSPTDFHSVLAFASLYVGEGFTTASECVQLGTPVVLINSLKAAYIEEQEKYGMLFYFKSTKGAVPKIKELAERENIRSEFAILKENMFEKLIDCTAFLTWLIDSYPNSISDLRKNKDYLQRFK